MIDIVETVLINNDQTVKTPAGEFAVSQRNEGFAVNDGTWNVTQLPELYWSGAGVLRQRRSERFLGAFADTAAAAAAIESADLMPLTDRMVR
jgi:hypothetical protein